MKVACIEVPALITSTTYLITQLSRKQRQNTFHIHDVMSSMKDENKFEKAMPITPEMNQLCRSTAPM
jgi:hypothetical protein